MTAKIDGTTGSAPAYDVEPIANQSTPTQPASTTAVTELTEQTPDTPSTAGKRLESAFEVDYMRDQLNQAQHRPAGGVLYDHHSHDPARNVTETKTPAPASLVGLKLGTGKDNKNVQVTKEIGSPQGYDDEREAIAVARMAGTEPAAVVKINDKWHAVETSADPSYADGTGTTRQHSEGNAVVQGLPPYSEVKKLGSDIAASRDRLQAEKDISWYTHVLNTPLSEAQIKKDREYLNNPNVSKAEKANLSDTLPENRSQVEQKLKDLEKQYPSRLNEAETKQLTEKLDADRRKMAPLLFGLPASQIQFNASSSNDDPNKMINIDLMTPNTTGDVLGREHYPRDQNFQPGLKPTFGIKLEELDDPKGAAGVLFHEVSHLKDDELAQKWVEQYQKTGHQFVSTPEGLPPFQKWMNGQVGKQLPTQPPTPPLTQADAQTVVDKAYNQGATSEARAYVHAAIAALQAGNGEEAINQLKTYASALKDGRAASPATDSAVQPALTKELQDLYRTHPELRGKIQDAINAAKSANSSAWISKISFSK
jgi:hypothetical protein